MHMLLEILGLAAILAILPASAVALAPVGAETGFVLNTFAFLIWGALVMWMCAGFTMLEAGSVRKKNASVICMKNIGLYSITALAYYVIGYNIMHVDVDGGFFGSPSLFRGSSADEIALMNAAPDAIDQARETLLAGSSGHATMSDWFFQMVFVATTASIISGTLAERVRLWSFFLFVAVQTAFIYPIVGAWTWGSGWLAEMGFQDFAGSTIVHSTGGWAALSGAMLIGARRGRFRKDGTVRQMPPSSVPIVTLGVFILWLGWFGFNGGSQLALNSATDAVALGNIFANTNIAASAGLVVALVLSKPVLGRMDLLATLNGVIAGLVAITAGPDLVDHQWAILIGGVGGAVAIAGLRLLETVRVDDGVGAIPAHLFAGIWGTLAVCIAAGGNLFVQLTGIVAIGIFVFGVSTAIWMLIDRLIGLRVSPSAEQLGKDFVELGVEAYPEFVAVPEADDDD